MKAYTMPHEDVLSEANLRSTQRRAKALLVSASVGLALAAVITLGYSFASSESAAKPSALSFTPRFSVLQDSTGDGGGEAATATQGAASADAAAQEAVDGAAEDEMGRGEGGKWDNTDVGRGLGGKWDINAQEKKVLSPDFAAKYGMAAATASQRMFNQIGVARDGTPVTEAQARSIASRYGMVPVSLDRPPKMIKQVVRIAPAPVSYATAPTVMYPGFPAYGSYATMPAAAPAEGPPPGYKIVAGPPQMTVQTVAPQASFMAMPAAATQTATSMAPQPLFVAGLTAQEAADQGQAASDGVTAPTVGDAPEAEDTPTSVNNEEASAGAAEETPPAAGPSPATPAESTQDAPSIENSSSAWGIPLLSGSVMTGKPVVFSGPRVVTSPFAMPAGTVVSVPSKVSAAASIPMGVPAVVAGAARLIPSPASAVFRFASNAPGAAVSAGPLGSGTMSVTGMSGVGSEFIVRQGQVVGQGLSAAKGVGQGVEVSVSQGDGKGMGLTVGSGQEAGYGLSALTGSAAGDGVVVSKGVAQGRGITVHQGSVAGQGILIGNDGTGHGEFIGSGSGSGTDISVSKGTAVGEGISMAQGQASGDGLTVNAGAVKGSGLAGRQGSGQGSGVAVGSGSVRGVDVRVVQGSAAGEEIYVQHGSLATAA